MFDGWNLTHMWAAQASPGRVSEWAVWALKTSLTPPLFIEVPILIKKVSGHVFGC